MPEMNQSTETVTASQLPEPNTVFTLPTTAVGESMDIDFWALLVEARIIS